VRDVVRAALCDLVTEFCPDDADTLLPRLDSDEGKLKSVYRALDAWPSDAQFALHAIAIVMGPGVRMRTLESLTIRSIPDFHAAADAALMSNRGHSGIVAMNDRVARGFRNAGSVVKFNRNSERLYYPLEL
jgi:hypothetical protein